MGSGEGLEDLGLGSQVPRPETLGPHMPSLRSQVVSSGRQAWKYGVSLRRGHSQGVHKTGSFHPSSLEVRTWLGSA